MEVGRAPSLLLSIIMTDSALDRTAALIRIGLTYGFVSVPEAIAWADAQIAAHDHPHPALVEISMGAGRSATDLANELHPLAGEGDEGEAVTGMLALMHRALSRDPGLVRRFASVLYNLAMAGVEPDGGDAEGWMMYFDDALDLAQSGISGTEDGVLREMLAFLAPYAERAAEHPGWPAWEILRSGRPAP